ncbi:MAG TPA: PLP-dependent aminotransferase family protein [Anaerolineae bacterium]|nr:PLP-dependent aminotransferase family protein [Anaerolineae bacterium]
MTMVKTLPNLQNIQTLPVPNNEPQFADWTYSMERSVLRQMIAVVAQPGILSFAGGLPDPKLFPSANYSQALSHTLATDPKALQYMPPSPILKQHIVDLMAQRGVTCTPDEIFITTGAQQGLDVLTRMFLNPGGQVLMENIIYTGAQQVTSPFQPEILTVNTDLNTGMDVDAVADLLAAGHRPAYIYVIPEAHNPLGVSLSQPKRQQLIHLARQYQIPIIEDDPYCFLSYDKPAPPPIRSLDDDWVFYLGSFSKIMAPALRLGWMVAPAHLINKLTVAKEMSDLESSALTQRAVAHYLSAGHLAPHLDQVRAAYGQRRDLMLQALTDYFPTSARWTQPHAGMFIWVELPPHINTKDLLQQSIDQEKVAFIPGYAFAVDKKSGTNCLRLNYSNCDPDLITDGIARLANVINQHLT